MTDDENEKARMEEKRKSAAESLRLMKEMLLALASGKTIMTPDPDEPSVCYIGTSGIDIEVSKTVGFSFNKFPHTSDITLVIADASGSVMGTHMTLSQAEKIVDYLKSKIREGKNTTPTGKI
jgi:hypothetical protein